MAGGVAPFIALANGVCRAATWFFVLYPIISSMSGITAALFFFMRWEQPVRQWTRRGPPVTVLVYAHNHADTVAQGLIAARDLDYGDVEIVVIDDGSTDDTVRQVAPFVLAGQVRMLAKAVSEGRAMALNDAIPCINGEIVLLLDADMELAPGVLMALVPHFETARVAVMAGNFQIRQPHSLLAHYQALECAAIYSLSGRAQRVMGRGYAIPGTPMAWRKTALQEIGYFDPQMASAEMDAAWRLQMRSWDLRYEPRAMAWRQASGGAGVLLQRHMGAAVALLQMLVHHAGIWRDRRYRRMWPLYAGACLSMLWAVAFWVAALLWLARAASDDPWSALLALTGPWGMAMVSFSMLQAAVGLLADRQSNPQLRGNAPYLALFPVLHGLFHATARVAALLAGGLAYLLRRMCEGRGRSS